MKPPRSLVATAGSNPKNLKNMSKNVAGILGNQYGKVGPVVARKFREENVYSKYQPNVKNPRTEKQMVQRARFKALSELAHAFACGARMGFIQAASGTNMSPRNLFQKLNFPNVSASGPESVNVDYTAIQVAKGALARVAFSGPRFDTPNQVDIDWTQNGAPCQMTEDDMVYVVVHCPDARSTIVSNPVKRTEETTSVTVPSHWNGMKVHVYGFVRNDGADNTEFGIPHGECSDSVYCGTGNIG